VDKGAKVIKQAVFNCIRFIQNKYGSGTGKICSFSRINCGKQGTPELDKNKSRKPQNNTEEPGLAQSHGQISNQILADLVVFSHLDKTIE